MNEKVQQRYSPAFHSHRSFARSPSADRVMSKASYMKSLSKVMSSRNAGGGLLSASTLGERHAGKH